MKIEYYPSDSNICCPENEIIESSFTGLKVTIEDNEISKDKYIGGKLWGESIFLSKDYSMLSLYINGEPRFTYMNKNNKDGDNHQSCIWNYDNNLEVEILYCRNGKNVGKPQSISFTRSDLNFDKLLLENSDVVDFYEKEGHNYDYGLDILIHHSEFLCPPTLTQKENKNRVAKTLLAYLITRNMDKEDARYNQETEFLQYYVLQDELRTLVITENYLPEKIKYIAGVDVAYHDLSQKMVGAVVVLDAETLEVVDSAVHIMDVSFPYIPGLFSFREIPPILEAYKKLKILPDLIVCDGQGIAHPKNIGMASHLGIELNIPTIGCAKKRLVGFYEKDHLGKKRGDFEELIWEDRVVGKALRTQTDANPVFVSIGHKIDLATSVEWVMKLTPKYRLPETTRQADQLVNQYLKERTDYDFFNDEGNNQ